MEQQIETRRLRRPRAEPGPQLVVGQLAAAAAPATKVAGERPSVNRLLLRNPVALFSLVPREAAMFVAGGVAGAIAKTTTAPLDRARTHTSTRTHASVAQLDAWQQRAL